MRKFYSKSIVSRRLKPNRPLGYGLDTTHVESKKGICTRSASELITMAQAVAKYQPNLSFIGMQHAILLGANYVKKMDTIKYDAVFTSASVRAIMTALVALRGTNYTINVIPFISEALNLASWISADNQNQPVKSDVLKRHVAFEKTGWK